MKFHREGIASLLLVVLLSVLLNWIFYQFVPYNMFAEWLLWATCAFVIIVVVQFFRSPSRIVTPDDNQVLSPCDGKVVVIEKITETEYFKDERIQVSIFMSPVNVHINWWPITGAVKYVKYHAGKYLVAWHPKSSTDNERNTVVVEDANGFAVLCRQIAGALARRIMSYGIEGENVIQGSELGFIKFGSRVDVILPVDAKIQVKLDQKVTGNKSVIALKQ